MRAHVKRAAVLVWPLAVLILLARAGLCAQAADLKFEAYLVWGTDDAAPPPGKDYKPVEPEIAKALKEGPLKWKNWFEVNHKVFSVAPGGTTNVPISDKCQITVQSIGGDNLEVVLIGKGKEAGRRKQPLPKGHILMLSGPAPNSTAWLVVLKRIQ